MFLCPQEGGGLVQQLRRSYSITDMSDRDWGQDRFTDVTDQVDQGSNTFLTY